MTDNCEHRFIYKGIVYHSTGTPMAGTGATPIRYYEEFFCEKCLIKKRKFCGSGHTYENIRYNATPISGIPQRED